ncbi:MAG: phytanoyl-CoA dioxygenase family protein [Bryobacteraceae bacterium]
MDGAFVYRQLDERQFHDYAANGYHRYGPILTPAGLDRMRRECRPPSGAARAIQGGDWCYGDESKAIPVPMQAGECLFFNCWTLHKSEGNFSDRDRPILFLRYADADAAGSTTIAAPASADCCAGGHGSTKSANSNPA